MRLSRIEYYIHGGMVSLTTLYRENSDVNFHQVRALALHTLSVAVTLVFNRLCVVLAHGVCSEPSLSRKEDRECPQLLAVAASGC